MFYDDVDQQVGNELTFAVQSQNIERVSKALAQGLHPDDPEAWDDYQTTPLCQAIGDIQDAGWGIVQLLLNAGASVNGVEGASKTPLETAAFYGEGEFARELVRLGADIDGQGGEGTPLEIALRERQDDTAVMLLAMGATGLELATDISDEDIEESRLEMLRSNEEAKVLEARNAVLAERLERTASWDQRYDTSTRESMCLLAELTPAEIEQALAAFQSWQAAVDAAYLSEMLRRDECDGRGEEAYGYNDANLDEASEDGLRAAASAFGVDDEYIVRLYQEQRFAIDEPAGRSAEQVRFWEDVAALRSAGASTCAGVSKVLPQRLWG